MEKDVEELLKKIGAEKVNEFKLIYDSPIQQLEPIYYWLLDFTRDLGFEVEKLVDNFTASPGSGYFAEIGRRATIMQEQAMKYLGAINQVIKSIINLLWDLKEFEIRLKLYDALKSKDEKERFAALNALKEIWITKVDIQKGRGAINVLTTQLEFVTLRDAFFTAKNVEDVDNLDLNDRVKNILRSRLIEFNEWLKRSEKELRNRFNIEKTYLKSQLASLKLYSRWARPYIKAAEELMMKESKDAALVSAFSTMILNLLLLCYKRYSIDSLPAEIKQYFAKREVRNYYGLVFIDFKFRSIPRSTGREAYYAFGGRVDIGFSAWVIDEVQFKKFKEEFEKQQFEEIIRIASDITEETLKTLAKDLKYFLEGKDSKEENKEEKKKGIGFFEQGGIITDIINIFKHKKKEEKKERRTKEIKEENYYEKYLKEFVKKEVEGLCFTIYDVYKKSHGMASYPNPYEE